MKKIILSSISSHRYFPITLFLVSLILSLSAFLTVIAGGSVYPPLLVALVASLGASFGDLVSFAFGYSSRHVALKKLEKHVLFVSLENIFKRYGSIVIFM